MKFDKNTSLAIKGIAILMMLLHHLFRTGLDVCDRFNLVFYPFPETNIRNVATVFKICVSLFTFVSGYGLFLDYNGSTLTSEKWVLKRLIKLLSGFWLIMIFCWIICYFLDGRFLSCYFCDGLYKGFVYLAIEFLGVAQIFGTPKLVTEWWYMSAAVTYVLFIPLISFTKNKLLLLVYIAIIPRILGIGFQGGIGIYSFLFVFILGTVCARYDFVNRYINLGKGKAYLKFGVELIVILLGYKFYLKIPINMFWEFHYGLYPLAVIIFAIEFIAYIPYIRRFLIFFGKHSTNIYLIHTLFCYIYLSEFIYNRAHFLVSYAILLLLSLGCSILIEWFKRIIGYKLIIDKICKRIDS